MSYETMYCCKCAKKATKNRTVDNVTKICSACATSDNADAGAGASAIPVIDDDATLDAVKFSDYKIWMLSQLNPIHEDIKTLKENAAELERQKFQIGLLQKRCDKHEETIETLKGVIAQQQRSLRSQDSEIRQKNFIVSGISENDITDSRGTYKNDDEKITALFREMGTQLPDGYTIERLGKPSDKYARSIKLNVVSKTNRNEIGKKSTELRNKQVPWDKVYLNYDLHPGDLEENKRLRKKKKTLKSLEENKDKEIKIEKGNLMVDGEIVDSNILFR